MKFSERALWSDPAIYVVGIYLPMIPEEQGAEG
jgi:hypothetical protein